MQPNITIKFAGYVAESSSVNTVNLAKNYHNSRDIEFFLGDYYYSFMASPV